MGFNPITYALIKKESERASTGISNVSVSDDGKSIIFTETNGNKLSISQSDWEALTPEEREKISKLIITGLGDSILCDDGVYRSFIPKASYNYNDIEGKPSINSVVLEGNKTLEELKFSEVSKTGSYNSLTGLPNIPSKVSEVSNNSAFITRMVNDLVNYYSKASIYTKHESENLISQAKTFSVEIVEELPTDDISPTIIYLIKESGSAFYTQWIYVDGAWITIGSTEIDMSKFYTISETDVLVDGKVDEVEGYGLSQENFSPENKDKLETYQEYKPSIISKNNLGILRVDGETIVIKNGVLSSPSGGGGMEPLNVTNINIESSDRTLTIKWKDPEDRIISGQTVSKWKGTKLVYKTDSYPKNESDGILVVDNTIRNQYENDGFIIAGLTNGVTYYFQLFPYSDTMVYNKNVANQFEGVPNVSYKVMTAVIDTTNSNPETSVSYSDYAVNMVPGSNDWDAWFGEYPCMFKDGQETGKIMKTDFTKYESGEPINNSDGSKGDAMIAFPRMGIKIETVGTDLKVSMTDEPNANGFVYYAHQRGETNKDVFYVGVYKGIVLANKLCSISGKAPTWSKTIGQFRNDAKAKGIGYDLFAYHQLKFIQVMYLLKYKNLNSQSTIGVGYYSNVDAPLTGGTDTTGMTSGNQNYNTSIKLFGIESLWGANFQWIDGLITDGSGQFLVGTDNFNDAGTGYMGTGKYTVADYKGYISQVQGTNELGFLIKDNKGSTSTYYCDHGNTKPNCVALSGGVTNTPNGADMGIFDVDIRKLSSEASVALGGRLMYL